MAALVEAREVDNDVAPAFATAPRTRLPDRAAIDDDPRLVLLRSLARSSRPFIVVTSVVLVAAIGLLDVVTGPDLSLAVLYLVPVSLLTWLVHRAAGVIVSVLVCVGVLVLDIASGTRFSGRFVPYWNAGALLMVFLAVVTLLAFLQRVLEHERQLARTDPLTGVANARHLYDVAQAELSRARRYARSITLAYIDVDGFKVINDDHGHRAGDEVLRSLAGTLRESVRDTDLVARIGGDEFAVLFPETAGESAESVVRRIHGRVLSELERGGAPVTVSIGAATFTTPPAGVDDLIWGADQLMYSVKRRGKNSLSVRVLNGAPSASSGSTTPAQAPAR